MVVGHIYKQKRWFLAWRDSIARRGKPEATTWPLASRQVLHQTAPVGREPVQQKAGKWLPESLLLRVRGMPPAAAGLSRDNPTAAPDYRLPN